MPNTKPLRFDSLTLGDRFRVPAWGTSFTYIKVGATRAVWDCGVTRFAVRACQIVDAFLAEPQHPEPIAPSER